MLHKIPEFLVNGVVKMLLVRYRQTRVNSSVNHEKCAPQLDLDNICANKILYNKAVVVNGKPPDLFLAYHGFSCHLPKAKPNKKATAVKID